MIKSSLRSCSLQWARNWNLNPDNLKTELTCAPTPLWYHPAGLLGLPSPWQPPAAPPIGYPLTSTTLLVHSTQLLLRESKGAGPDSLSKHIRLQVTTLRSSLRLKQSKATIYYGWKGMVKDATWYLQQDSQFPRGRSKILFLSVLHYKWHLKGPGKYTEGDEWVSHILGGRPESTPGHELDLKPKVTFKLWT